MDNYDCFFYCLCRIYLGVYSPLLLPRSIERMVIGRLLQFSSIIWLSIHLYKLRLIKIWHPIISSILGLLGIVSAIVIMITHFNIPKRFEILLIFFIPGFSFFLLYWLAVAILTKCKKNEIITWQNRTQQKNG